MVFAMTQTNTISVNTQQENAQTKTLTEIVKEKYAKVKQPKLFQSYAR